MADDRVSQAGEGNTMHKPRVTFDINLGTWMPIILLALAGWNRYAALETKTEVMDQRGQSRIVIADNFYAKTEAALSAVSNAPNDIAELKKGQETANARMDRMADIMLSGQDQTRRDMQAGFDSIRKDIGTISTKIEVVGSKVDGMNGKPINGALRFK